jgi:hypothetical protein
MGHSDPIETVKVTHEEGNEGEKIGVERGNGGFYGGKLLKRQGDDYRRAFQPWDGYFSFATLRRVSARCNAPSARV